MCIRHIIELFNCVFQFIKSTGRFYFNASENMCIKVCMFVCLVLCKLSYVISLWVLVSVSICMNVLYVSVSCPVYIVVRLMLFHYGCLSKRTSVKMFVCLSVLYCIYCCTSYVISLWVCVSESICKKVLYVSVSCPVYIVVRLMLFHYGCLSKRTSV